jgi:predicted DNA-binding ribbon-helix-helix protein
MRARRRFRKADAAVIDEAGEGRPARQHVIDRPGGLKLESEIWNALCRSADHQGVGVHELTGDRNRATNNLTSAVRAYVVGYLTAALSIKQQPSKLLLEARF